MMHYDERQKRILYDCGDQGCKAIVLCVIVLLLLQVCGFRFLHTANIPIYVFLISFTWFGINLIHNDILFSFSYEQQPQRYYGIRTLCLLLTIVFAFLAFRMPFPIDWQVKLLTDGCLYYIAALLFFAYTMTLSLHIRKQRNKKEGNEDA